jgi:hypothetical protein
MKELLAHYLEKLERLSEEPLIIQVVALDPDGETLRNHVIGCSPQILSAYKHASDAFIELEPETGELARSLVFQTPNEVVHQKVIRATKNCTRPPLQIHDDRYLSEPVRMSERLKNIDAMALPPGARKLNVSSLEKYFRDCLAEYLLDNEMSSATLIWLQNKISENAVGSLFAVFKGGGGKGKRKNHRALQGLSELLQSSIISHYTERLQRGARSSAVAAIMSRNLSHNIGSHVTPAASLDQIDRRMREQEQVADWWQGEGRYECVADLKKRLDTYIQSRSDFLAEVATVPLVSTKPARFYSEVILPFVENTLLIDSIASGEGIRYRSDPATHLTRSRLVLRVWVQPAGAAHPVELRVMENCAKNEYGYPHGLPYTLRNQAGRRLTRGKINRPEFDMRVGLPGPLGEHAMYGILENHIRNAAKHNRARLAEGDGDLEIHLLLQEGDDEGTYSLTLSDNVSDACGSMRSEMGEETFLHQHLDALLSKDLIDHHTHKTGWGLAEMKVCAALLRGLGNLQDREVTSGEYIHHRSLRVLSPAEANELSCLPTTGTGRVPLAYRFVIRKARELCVVATPQEVPREMEGEYRSGGIELLRSLAELQQRVKPASGPPLSCELVLVSADSLDASGGPTLYELLPYLPVRVVVALSKGGTSSPIPSIEQQTQKRMVVAGETPPWANPGAALVWTWEAWLSRWSVDRDDPVHVHVQLEQACTEEPTSSWLKAASELNRENRSIRLCVWGKTDQEVVSCMNSGPTALPGEGRTEVVYDRHGALCRDHVRTPLVFVDERRALSLLEKRSSDFNALFSQTPQTFATLPWRLAEAGLLRVLVIDERLAGRSMQSLAGPISGEARNASLGYLDSDNCELESLRLWHAAWASNVYFCTRFCIAGGELDAGPLMTVFDESKQPLSPGLEVVLSLPEVRFSWNGGGAHQGSRLTPDILLIHKGVIDKSVDKVALRERGLPEFPRKAIVDALLGAAPVVVVVSGRGDPHTFDTTLPAEVRFMPFATAEGLLVDPVPAKLTLAQVNMSLQYTARKHG